MNQNNEYLKFIDYLKNNTSPKSQKKVEKKENKIIPPSPLITEKKNRETPPQEISIKKEEKNTTPVINSSGFDIKKFEELMRKKLIDDFKQQQSYEKQYFSVTELCGCIRKSFYSRLRYNVNINEQYKFPYLDLINKIGESVHKYILELYDFSEIEKNIISEVYKIKGRADAIKSNVLYEIKTIDEYKVNNTYIEEHLIQAGIYSFILNEEYNYNIDTITLVYVPRTLKKIITYDCKYEKNKFETYVKRSIELKNAIESKKVPEANREKQEFCRYCFYLDFCNQDKNKKIVPNTKKEKNDLDIKNKESKDNKDKSKYICLL